MLREDALRNLVGRHFQREECHGAGLLSRRLPLEQPPRNRIRDVDRERALSHASRARKDDQVGAVQTSKSVIEARQPGR